MPPFYGIRFRQFSRCYGIRIVAMRMKHLAPLHCRSCPGEFIYEHVTCNINSTDLTVNNVHKYACVCADQVHIYISVYKIQSLAGCAAV